MHANGLGTTDPTGARQTALPGARLALAMLLIINLFNYIDRQVLAAVEDNIRHELLADEPDLTADPKMGLLSTAFMISYMVIAPLFGWLGDRMSRWFLIAVGVILWSLASGASGLHWALVWAHPFWILMLTRCFVGVGEGAYGPVAPTLISDYYPVSMRGKALAWFYLAIPVGSALGYTLGGQVAAMPGLGWRWAFYLVVPPGIILGILCFFLREPPRGQADMPKRQRPQSTNTGVNPPQRRADVVDQQPQRRPQFSDYLTLLRTPSYILDTLGMTAMTFGMGAIAFWMKRFLIEHEAQPIGPIEPVTFFGGLMAISGLLATLLGGILGDWLKRWYPSSYFLVSSCAMLVGFPMVVLAVIVPFPWAWGVIFVTVFCLFFNTGPSNTILANVTHPSIRATAFAVNIFIIHALGDVISPPLIGFIKGRYGLDVGFYVISVAIFIGGLFWLWGARYLEADTRLAPERLNVSAPTS